MAKKSGIRAEDITEKDILSIYDRVLPLLHENPKEINPMRVLQDNITPFVPFDFFTYLMEDPEPPESDNERMTTTSYQWPVPGNKGKIKKEIKIYAFNEISENAAFKEKLENGYKENLARRKKEYPNERHIYKYYKLFSFKDPKVALVFSRVEKKSGKSAFTTEEKKIIDKLSPYLILLTRTILAPEFKSERFKYFISFGNICSKIARDHQLSDTEIKLLPEILFGFSNEEIAEKNFVTVAAIKKHIKHIFKKTETKNRVDFISKFFTSPDRINL